MRHALIGRAQTAERSHLRLECVKCAIAHNPPWNPYWSRAPVLKSAACVDGHC